MGIQAGGGQLRIDADDPQFTHRGKQIAVKIRDFGDGQVYMIGCRRDAAGWVAAADLFAFDDAITVENTLGPDGTHRDFMATRVLPTLNAWLATEFPADDAPLGPLQRLFRTTQDLAFLPQMDGTLRAVLP